MGLGDSGRSFQLRVLGAEFRVDGIEYRVYDLGLRVKG